MTGGPNPNSGWRAIVDTLRTLLLAPRLEVQAVAMAAGLASLAALVASSIDLGALSALVTALGAVADLGICRRLTPLALRRRTAGPAT